MPEAIKMPAGRLLHAQEPSAVPYRTRNGEALTRMEGFESRMSLSDSDIGF